MATPGGDTLLSTFSEPEEPETREVAVAGMIRNGGQAVPALIKKLATHQQEYPAIHERVMAIKVLGEIGDQSVLEPLIAALDDPSADVKENAKMALARLTK